MSTDSTFTPPKKKPSALWWLGGGFALLIALFFLQLFGPNPPIVVSPQTTHITTPLRPDGLPDYERHLLENLREGVTPENNAAVLVWQALWPGDLNPSDRAAVAAELGLNPIPSPDQTLVPVLGNANQGRIAEWLRETAELQRPNDAAASDTNVDGDEPTGDRMEFMDDSYSQVAETLLNGAISRPWTGEQIPPLAKWVTENQQPLNLLAAASRRSRFYSPSPSLIDNKLGLLATMTLPGIQSVREAGRSLPARAMWHVGEGRPMDAWRDLLALHRLSRLVAQGRTLVEQLVAIAMGNIAADGTLTLLDHGNLTAEETGQVQRDLAALPRIAGMAQSLDQGERLWALDAFVHAGSGSLSDFFSAFEMADADFGNSILTTVSVDWNFVLRDSNDWYDRMSAAARLPNAAARRNALDQIDSQARQMVGTVRTPRQWPAGVVSRTQRSKLVSAMMMGLFLPALNAATDAEDRANAILELTRLAAALAAYRAERGAYPEKLDELVPTALDKLPVDLHNGKPFVYKRTKDGYLLYSVGENGVDDGGSNEVMNNFQGREIGGLEAEEFEKLDAQIPAGADDHSIRIPRPKFALPKVAPRADGE